MRSPLAVPTRRRRHPGAARPSLALAMALFVGPAIAGCREGRGAHPPVVWIVIDTLRADHLEWYGYDRETAPQLRALVERSALFEHAYTPLPPGTRTRLRPSPPERSRP